MPFNVAPTAIRESLRIGFMRDVIYMYFLKVFNWFPCHCQKFTQKTQLSPASPTTFCLQVKCDGIFALLQFRFLAVISQQIVAHGVVPYTKFYISHSIGIEVRVKRNVHRIWIAMKKALEKRSPAHIAWILMLPRGQRFHITNFFVAITV